MHLCANCAIMEEFLLKDIGIYLQLVNDYYKVKSLEEYFFYKSNFFNFRFYMITKYKSCFYQLVKLVESDYFEALSNYGKEEKVSDFETYILTDLINCILEQDKIMSEIYKDWVTEIVKGEEIENELL